LISDGWDEAVSLAFRVAAILEKRKPLTNSPLSAAISAMRLAITDSPALAGPQNQIFSLRIRLVDLMQDVVQYGDTGVRMEFWCIVLSELWKALVVLHPVCQNVDT